MGGLPITDGVVTIRSPRATDRAALVAGRDAEHRRFLGEGSPDPRPVAVVEAAGAVVGWVDHDDRAWLPDDECNVGYALSGDQRGRGYATRAVALLLHHLALEGRCRAATVLIDPANERSLALADRLRFTPAGEVDGSRLLRRAVPPLRYTHGRTTLRRRTPADLDQHLAAIDDQQIDWLWLPGHREQWEAMSAHEQRAHGQRHLEADHAEFGRGPKWTFALDTPEASYVAYVDCDLANDKVPAGSANVSYATHPDHRGQGHATTAVRLVFEHLRDHTAAPEAHVIVDSANRASRGVARAVGAVERERWVDEHGRTMIRHVQPLRESPTGRERS